MGKRLPKSVRKFIRQEKARIRRGILDFKEQNKIIEELYSKFLPKPDSAKIANKNQSQNLKL